ncbi:hypothetical protein ACHAQJ_002092, partial [Trichoderma viride]
IMLRAGDKEAFKRFQLSYKGLDEVDFDNLSEDEEVDCYRELVQGVFRPIGLNHENHDDCYRACIQKCVGTHAIKAQTWSGWSGYSDFANQVKQIARLTKSTKRD